MPENILYMIDTDQYGQRLTMGQVDRTEILTPALCRAARGFLDWTQSDLSEQSGISRSTIRDYEGDHHAAHRATLAQLRLALERGGVSFVSLAERKTAVCLAQRSGDDLPHQGDC